ncbi:Limkain-b1-like [Tropilaelaps mercedesae]|uniref:Meiosis regulator and mRNA stability factor 1 n=1 Tax=Tropilaelaps mercedesae TaxID=418985 RepID=A0A1V9Y049_9ACAR|nr:Limkain-b1-like [Tropilaelaps mercedesae]
MSRKKRSQATGGKWAHQCNSCIPPYEPINGLQRNPAHGVNNSLRTPQINSIRHSDSSIPPGVYPGAVSGVGYMRSSVPDLSGARRAGVWPTSLYSCSGFVNGLDSDVPRRVDRVLGTSEVNGGGHGVPYGVLPHLMQQQSWRASDMFSSNKGLGAFQENHVGPNVQPCQNEQSFYGRGSQSLPVLILWDVENVQMPKKVPVAHAVHAVRTYVQKAVGRTWFETDFAVACDVFRQQTRRVAEMNNAQITVIHVNSMSKNAADMKLKVYMHKFATMFSQQSACVVLISGDVNFAPSLHLARHHAKLQVVLLHNQLTSSTLLKTAHYADDFYRVVMTTPWLEGPASVWAGGECLPPPQRQPGRQSTHLLVANLPEDFDAARIIRRLHKMSSNTGGRVIEVRGSLALMRFPSAQNATRALTRMDERDVCGQQVRVHFVDDPVSRDSRNSALSCRPNAEASNSSPSASAKREPSSGAKAADSNTSSESVSAPCILDIHEAGDSSCLSSCNPCALDGQIDAAFDSSCTTETFGEAAVSSPCTTYSSDSGDDTSCSSQLGLSLPDPRNGEQVGCTCSCGANAQNLQGGRSILDYLLVTSDQCGELLQNSLCSSPMKLGTASSTNLQDVCRSPPCAGLTWKGDLVVRTGESESGSSAPSQSFHHKRSWCMTQDECQLSVLDATGVRDGRGFEHCDTFDTIDIARSDLLEHRAKCSPRHEPGATSTFSHSSVGRPCNVCSCSNSLSREAHSKVGQTSVKDKAEKTGRRPSVNKRSARKILYLRHHTHIEKSLMTLVYFVHEILNGSASFSLRGDDDYDFVIGEPESSVLPLDASFFEDLQQIAAGHIPQSGRSSALVKNVGASLIAILMGRLQLVGNCVETLFGSKSDSRPPIATAEQAKLFLRTTSNDMRLISLPDALGDISVAKRISSLQEILQEMASMLLAMQYCDVHESAKALTSLNKKSREEFIQRWISQLVDSSRTVHTLDPFRSLQRCRQLPKTVHDGAVEDGPRLHFSITGATNHGGPDVALVLAVFMTSPSPLSIRELGARFFKAWGRALPLPAVHLLHELGAIETLRLQETANNTQLPVQFDLKGVCAVVRHLIRQMSYSSSAVYHLESSAGRSDLGCLSDQYSIAHLLRSSGASELTDRDVATMLDDFSGFFEKLSDYRDSKSGTKCHHNYRLRQCVAIPIQTHEKKHETVGQGGDHLAGESHPSTQAGQRGNRWPQISGFSQDHKNSEEQRPASKKRRSVRLAAVFDFP